MFARSVFTLAIVAIVTLNLEGELGFHIVV